MCEGTERTRLKREVIAARRDSPEINHLNILHPSEHPYELLRALDPRADDRQLAEACQTLQRTGILEEIVVEVQHANIGDHAREIRRKRDDPARGQLKVDEVVARFGEEARLERIACTA